MNPPRFWNSVKPPNRGSIVTKAPFTWVTLTFLDSTASLPREWM